MHFAFCSAKDCSYSERFGREELFGKPDPFGDVVKPSKYCPKCGSAIATKCPHCGNFRQSISHAFCNECGKPYKE